MRVIIKDADFSSVSIGKVTKDLSFIVDSSNYKTKLLNPPYGDTLPVMASSTNNGGTTIYQASIGDNSYSILNNNANRYVTDFIEVISGMQIVGAGCFGTSSSPCIICFDEEKSPLVPVSSSTAVYPEEGAINFTIPSNCKYIKLQTTRWNASTTLQGTMPE